MLKTDGNISSWSDVVAELNENVDLENIVIHAPYIVNLGNTYKPDNFEFAIEFMQDEIKRADAIGATQMTMHPGLQGVTDRIPKQQPAANQSWLRFSSLRDHSNASFLGLRPKPRRDTCQVMSA